MEHMEYYNLNELGEQLEKEDLLLECSITLRVDVSIERPHEYVRDEEGQVRVALGDGWLVSLTLPANTALTAESPQLADGEQQAVGDLQYQSGEPDTISLEDALRVLGIGRDAKIWRVSHGA